MQAKFYNYIITKFEATQFCSNLSASTPHTLLQNANIYCVLNAVTAENSFGIDFTKAKAKIAYNIY